MLLAIDVGSGLTKAIFDDQLWYIPSVVAPSNLSNNIFVDDANTSERITMANGCTYFVGQTAMANTKPNDRSKTTSGSWFESNGSLILHLATIARAYPEGKTGVVAIVTGLPMSKYLDVKAVSLMKKSLIGHHKFSTEKGQYDLDITDESLLIVPQALGLHLRAISAELIKDSLFATDIVGYIDVGSFTSGFCQIQFNKLAAQYSDLVSKGMFHLATNMAPFLKEQFNFESNDISELLHHLKVGYINHRDFKGKDLKIDLLEESIPFIDETFKDVVNWINKNWRPNSMQLIISGGGAKYLLPYLQRKYPHIRLLNPVELSKGASGGKVTSASFHKASEAAIFDVVHGYAAYGNKVRHGESANG
jgi:hypothetical protein